MTFVVSDARILVLGTGVTGLSVQRVLTNLGAQVRITDDRDPGPKSGGYIQVDQVIPGDFDFAVVSPGWKLTHPLVQKLRDEQIPILSEIDLAWKIKEDKNPTQKWIGVTGTNGKTTTVELTTAILASAGLKVISCGNVGNTVIDAVCGTEVFDYLVVELSSFQLEWSALPHYSASAILNIADDHTDWHGNFEKYIQAKLRILDSTDYGILNKDDKVVVSATNSWQGEKIFFSLSAPRAGEVGLVEDLLVDRAFIEDSSEAEVIADLGDIFPQASHAVANSLASAAICRALGVDYSTIQATIKSFRPGRHRIEYILEENGVTWINDSKATNPHAAAASLRSFESIIWIAGGLAKGADMSELISEAASKIRVAILIGQDRELIATALTKIAPQILQIRVDGDKDDSQALMSKIVGAALDVAKAGDTVLLAPACASMDQFTNYASRGDLFRDNVLNMVAHK